VFKSSLKRSAATLLLDAHQGIPFSVQELEPTLITEILIQSPAT
jgi:hypothetical protein